MTQDFFQTQISRLRDCFGEKAFSEERVKLIWRNVNQLSDAWFLGLVDNMIATCKFAPLPADFFEAASIERERLWRIEKEKNAREAKEFMSSYGPEEIGSICQNIVARLRGSVTDEDFGKYLKLLESAPRKTDECQACSGDGWVLIDAPTGSIAYRCFCKSGDQRTINIKQISYYQWKESVAKQ